MSDHAGSKELQALQKEQEQAASAVAEYQARLAEVDGRLAKITDRFLTAGKKAQADLVTEWGTLISERDALQAAIAELGRRHDEAYLAYYEFELAIAQRRYDELKEENRALNAVFSEALEERRRFHGGRSEAPQDERDRRYIELEEEVAQLKARLTISARDLRSAGYRREKAAAALKRVKEELEPEPDHSGAPIVRALNVRPAGEG